MNRLVSFLKRRYFPLFLMILGLVLMLVSLQVITGTPGFSIFFTGAVAFVLGLIIIIY
jgi:uncharacterized membrane protein